MKISSVIAPLLLSLVVSVAGMTNDRDDTDNKTFAIEGVTEASIETGTRQYLVYFKEKDTGVTKMISVWNRTTSIIKRGGEQLIETKQTWASDDARFIRELYSLNRLDTFAPVAHRTKHGPDKITKAYLFSSDQVTADSSIEANSLQDFSMAANANMLNWELDMETFALLPLGPGKSFALNFYHPGSKTPPKDYIYKVVGSETLMDFEGNRFDCWLLKIDYNDKDHGIFWLSKKSGQMLKMEESWGNLLKYKVRLGLTTGL